MKRFVLVICVFLLPAFLCAQTQIIFINGINNTVADAINNSKSVHYRFCKIYDCEEEKIFFHYVYNPSEGFLDDIHELNLQDNLEKMVIEAANDYVKKKLPKKFNPEALYKKGSDEYNLFMAHVRERLAYIFYDRRFGYFMKDLNEFGFSQDVAHQDIYRSFVTILGSTLARLNSGLKVVLVAHSQGNYLAQAVKAYIDQHPEHKHLSDRLSVFGIGSASSVAQLSQDYVTHKYDRALAGGVIGFLGGADAHEFNNFFKLKYNFHAGRYDSDDLSKNPHPLDDRNHNLMNFYMGMRIAPLPDDRGNCNPAVIPAEEYMKSVSTMYAKYGKICVDEKDPLHDILPFIGIGYEFPELRGVFLYRHIVDGIYKSIPNTPKTTKQKLPHTGVKKSQCYKKGSNTLVACNSAEAIALSGAGKQDGMRGHINTMSYSEVPGFARTECVKDNLTGLMWEGKTSDGGLRDGGKRYTNHADGRAGSALDYVNQVNAQGLCGHHDWRLPTVDELQSLVDYSKPYPGPTIDTAWFPNTSGTDFWSGMPYVNHSSNAWALNFSTGYAYSGRYNQRVVRLVRASQ